MTEIMTAVVIPTMSRPDRLSHCIRSVLGGYLQPDQLIVCDQSKTEETRLMLERLDVGGVEVVYLHLDRPNASAARNAGMAAARAELIAYIDDDCTAEKGWLGALVKSYRAASSKEAVSAVTGRVLPLFAGEGHVAVSSRTSLRRRFFRARGGSLDQGKWAPWDAGTGANILCPRTALLSAGGFDTCLGPGTPAHAAEDIDLLFRLARVGTIVYEPDAVVYHPAGTRRKRIASRYVYGRGMGSMLARHLAKRDPAARSLLSLYIRHQGAQAFRRGLWGPVESLLSIAGASLPLMKYGLQGSGGRSKSRVKANQETRVDDR